MTILPFTSTPSGEILASFITEKAPVDLVVALISVALCFGIERTESAICATYPTESANKILSGINTALSFTV